MNQIEALNTLIAGVVTAYKRQAYDMAEVGPLHEAIKVITQPAPAPEQSEPKKEEKYSGPGMPPAKSPYSNQQ